LPVDFLLDWEEHARGNAVNARFGKIPLAHLDDPGV
jgi:hypothetical protein